MANIQLMRNMKILRLKSGFTQKAIASLFNISRQAYSNYETGKREPDLNFIIRFARYYDLTLEQLILQTVSPSDNFIREQKGPYISAVEDISSDTIQLSTREVELIMKYRTTSDDNRRIVDSLLRVGEKAEVKKDT